MIKTFKVFAVSGNISNAKLEKFLLKPGRNLAKKNKKKMICFMTFHLKIKKNVYRYSLN